MKHFVLAFASFLLLTACASEDFRSFQYDGGYFADVFYPLEANFYPSADGYDILTVSERDDNGELLIASRFIVKVSGKEINLITGAAGEPEFRLILKDGSLFTHKVATISYTSESILIGDYPERDGKVFSLFFNKGKKNVLPLYEKK